MAHDSIPVELTNPGQVFACMGFLEAAEYLMGDVRGGFEWSGQETKFTIHSPGNDNPFAVVLDYLAHAQVHEYGHVGYKPPVPKKKDKNKKKADRSPPSDRKADEASGVVLPEIWQTFPAPSGDPLTLPVRVDDGTSDRDQPLVITHWSDGSSRNDFKLFSGNRSAASIARAMLQGTSSKVAKKSPDVVKDKTRGVGQLWKEYRTELIKSPFAVLTAMGGSFNFDPRGAWTALDTGYSPNDQKHGVESSPVVEMLAAIGLEHARPDEYGTRQVRYGVWGTPLPPVLARSALGGIRFGVPLRVFRFTLDLAGKNKVVTFSREESTR